MTEVKCPRCGKSTTRAIKDGKTLVCIPCGYKFPNPYEKKEEK